MGLYLTWQYCRLPARGFYQWTNSSPSKQKGWTGSQAQATWSCVGQFDREKPVDEGATETHSWAEFWKDARFTVSINLLIYVF